MCALPSAQLGSLASLNMPSYIPTVQVQKEPKAWEKALLSIVANAGAAALGQGVQNAMSQDYAGEFGQTAETGFGKLLRGPKVGERQAESLRGQKIEKDKLAETSRLKEAELASADRNARLNRAVDMTRNNILGAEAFNRNATDSARVAADIEHNRDAAEIALAGQQNEASHRKLQDLIAQINAERQGRLADAQTGDIKSQTKLRTAQADQAELQNKIMRDATADKTKPAVNPNIAKFAQGMGKAQVSPQVDLVAQMVNSGMNPDDIFSKLKEVDARQSAVTDLANTRATAEEAAAAERAKQVEDIKRRLGLVPDPTATMISLPGVL